MIRTFPLFTTGLCFHLFGISAAFSQNVGIGTSTPNASAKLEISDANRGFLFPRVSLTATNVAAPVTAPANWLTVFNTNTVGTGSTAVSPGLYYWDNTASLWIRIQSGTTNWTLLGNAGTVDGTNFIGTTDNVPFNIRVNNIPSGRIDPTLANAFYGQFAGSANTTGGNNTAFGMGTMQANTTGGQNLSAGFRSLFSNLSGNYNVALGYEALYNNTTNQNTAVGGFALRANSTGANNVALGYNAAASNTIGTNNTAIGHNALSNNTNTSDNTVVGSSSMRNNTSGVSNAAVGSNTLPINTTGSNNAVLGAFAMNTNDIGSNNVAVGRSSLQNNTSGTNNVAVGYNALLTNTTAYGNIAVGTSSLQSNSGGIFNQAIGTDALRSNTSGQCNVGIGTETLRNNTTANHNIAIGYQVLMVNNGEQNQAIGLTAMRSNTSGYSNQAMGTQALLSNTTGFQNQAIGANSLYSNTTGSQIVAIGSSAGFINTVGSNNTFVGANTNATANNFSNATAIGANAIVGQSNALILGNNANVGIGTSTPRQKLEVMGNVQNNNDFFINLTFPAGFVVGDYIEFAEASTTNANATGYFEISFGSTRGNYASGATFIASASHANSYSAWRELAMVNSNPYVLSAGGHNFTIDINPQAYGANPRFRIRVINTIGINADCPVNIRIRSVNINAGWTTLNNTGTGATVAGFAKMTSEWNLITGNVSSNTDGNLAITAIENGNVGLGTRTPTEKLQVVGNGLFSGNVTAACGVLVCSDQRYKKEILPLQNALSNLMRLQGVTYNWKKAEFPDKGFDDRLQIGVIAQDLEKIYPELVNTDAKGFKTVDYPKFTPILIEAVKTQQAQIQALEQKMEAQAQENAALKARLGELDALKAELQNIQTLLKAHK